jgi:hypothetical protein
MIVRQEENTPIGDYFHDSGILRVFEKIQNTVDEFEVDTDSLNNNCDILINAIKGLKGQVKKIESAWSKYQSHEEYAVMINRGVE